MVADDLDDGAADLAVSFFMAGQREVRFVGHAEVGAQDVDADLALFCPIIGEAGEGVDADEADSGLVVAECSAAVV
ncbi:hypothetical protein CG723_45270 [Streptomyces sp. CB01635]|nr:hypothetical protein CG723_45270 [Streptomyces sp. CB01635]